MYSSPVPKAIGSFKCYIKRNNLGIKRKLYPQYELYVHSNDRFIMIGEKGKLITSAYYTISLDSNSIDRRSSYCIGKLRANISKSEFSLFGVGENLSMNAPPEMTRNEHVAIIYDSNMFNEETTAKMKIIIPEVIADNIFYTRKPLNVIMQKILGIRIYDIESQGKYTE